MSPSTGSLRTEMSEKLKRSRQSRVNGSPLSDESDSETDYLPARKTRPSLMTPPFSARKAAELNRTPDSACIAKRSQSKVIFGLFFNALFQI